MSVTMELMDFCRTCGLVLLCLILIDDNIGVKSSSPILYDSGEIKEYCQLEQFEASCPENEVVVISSGQYGRMKLGRCVRKGYGSLGCSIDVLQQIDRLCSGRQDCRFDVAQLHDNRHPCPTDLTPFLQGSYYCQKVIPGSPQGCASSARAITLTEPSGYLSNLVSMETGRGSEDCPWRIKVPEGQKINITLVNFARVTVADADQRRVIGGKPNICYQYAQFTEQNTPATLLTECEGGSRMVHAYLSQTSSVDVSILAKRDMDIYFMLYYEAVGCANPVVASTLWVQPRTEDRVQPRTEDTVIVKCNTTGDTWKLKCVGQEWQGDTGNCTLPGTPDWHVGTFFEGDGFPYSILLVVAIGVALGVFLGGILLVCASKYFKRRRNGQRSDNFQQSLYGVEHGKVFASQFDDVGGGSPRNLHYHGVHVEDTTTLPATEKSCKCTFSSYGPPPGYHPASHASHMYESPQFDRKDSR